MARITCGQGDSREAKWVRGDLDLMLDKPVAERDEELRDWQIKHALYCNIHRGANERHRYYKYDLVPLEDHPEVIQEVLRRQEINEAAAAIERQKKEKERYENAKKYAPQRWVDVETEYETVFVDPSEDYKGRAAWIIYPKDGSERSYPDGSRREGVYTIRVDSDYTYNDVVVPADIDILNHVTDRYPNLLIELSHVLAQAALYVQKLNMERLNRGTNEVIEEKAEVA